MIHIEACSLLVLAIIVSASCTPATQPTLAPSAPVAYKTSTPQPGPVAIPVQNPPDAPYPLVLSHPSYDSAPISNQLELGEAAPILGRDASGEWWQVEVRGELGWLPASAVEVMGDASAVAIVPAP
jgi:hypothetical protein